MSRARGVLATAAILLVAACSFTSPPPRQVAAVISPRGATATLTLDDRRAVRGELLAVSDSALLLLSEGRVVVAPRTRLHSVSLDGVGMVGSIPFTTFELRKDTPNWARFPQGIPAPVLAQLLDEARQTAPDTVGGPP